MIVSPQPSPGSVLRHVGPSNLSIRCNWTGQSSCASFVLVSLFYFATINVSLADDWPAFLGPHRTGVSDEKLSLRAWPDAGPAVAWTKPVGEGYSAPSVRGDQLVLHHRQRDEEIIEASHALTGESNWKYRYNTDFRDPYGYSGGPRCSPTLSETKCYTLGAGGQLICLNRADGALVWQRNLDQEWTCPEQFFGFGCTPLLDGDRLFVFVGGQPASAVVALNAQTGETIWESVGRATWDGVIEGARGKPFKSTGKEMLISYASPVLAEINQRKHLLCFLRQGLVSLDPATGAEQFKFWYRAKVHESVNAAMPVVVDDHILLSAAYELGAVLLKVAADGKSVSEVWRNPEVLTTHWSTVLHYEGYFFGFAGRHEPEGRLQCVEAKTGKLVWETTGYEGDLEDLALDQKTRKITSKTSGKPVPWPMFGRGSKIRVGDQFLVLGERGTLALLNVSSKKFSELSRFEVPTMRAPCWTAPVLANGQLYLRCEQSLIRIDLTDMGNPN